MRKPISALFFVVITLLLVQTGISSAHAATLTNAKDTITTSRPSASTPFSATAASGATQLSVYDNKSRFLKSDDAKIIRTSTNAIIDSSVTVSAQSSALTTVYTSDAGGIGAQAQNGTDVLMNPITAMHTIEFTTVNSIPVNGDIVLTFPALTSGDANNPASPSATTFQFNGIATAQVKVLDDGADVTANATLAVANPTAGNGGTISLNNFTAGITAGSVVKIFLGCTTLSGSNCSAQTPLIINPTKAATAGTADNRKLTIRTENDSDAELDSATVAIGVIDTVEVKATVDPTLTFSIAGIAHNTAANSGNGTGCLATETTTNDAVLASTATLVNLGTLQNTPTVTNTKVSNIAAQLITISTNAANGYVLTATSSGALRNGANSIDSNTTPTAFPSSGADYFGLNACGLDVNNVTWGADDCETTITGSTNACNYGWPTATTAVTLASHSPGPIGNSITTGRGLTSVRYAAGVDASVPAGEYQTAVTYVATATF